MLMATIVGEAISIRLVRSLRKVSFMVDIATRAAHVTISRHCSIVMSLLVRLSSYLGQQPLSRDLAVGYSTGCLRYMR